MGRVTGRQRFVCALLCAGFVLGLGAAASPAEARHRHVALRFHARHHRVAANYVHAGRSRVRHAGAYHSSPLHYGSNFAAMVVDANTGRTLYAVNENELRHPASITKVMTLYMLFEQLEKGKLRLDSEIPVSAHAASMPPTKLGLRAGSSITVENAIKAIVTQSANDMAVTVAEALGGSEENFAAMMTEKAHALGMTKTHYANASGLPNDQQLTTAHDLIVLGRAIQERFPRYYAYFSTLDFRYAGREMRNHNHLLGRIAGMDGIKTGFTNSSGYNMLTSVRRGGRHIVSVVLGGRTWASRDQIMTGLIDEHIAEASDGRSGIAENAPDIRAEAADIAKPEPQETPLARTDLKSIPAARAYASDKPRPAFVSGTPRVAAEDTSAVGSIAAKKRSALEGSTSAQAVTASASPHPTSTATPSALRWVVGPTGQTLKAASVSSASHAIAETKVAKADTGMTDVVRSEAAHPDVPHTGMMIQIGATDDMEKAGALLARARTEGHSLLTAAQGFTEKVQKGDATLYRARFAGLDAEQADAACKTLKRSGFACFTTKN